MEKCIQFNKEWVSLSGKVSSGGDDFVIIVILPRFIPKVNNIYICIILVRFWNKNKILKHKKQLKIFGRSLPNGLYLRNTKQIAFCFNSFWRFENSLPLSTSLFGQRKFHFQLSAFLDCKLCLNIVLNPGSICYFISITNHHVLY